MSTHHDEIVQRVVQIHDHLVGTIDNEVIDWSCSVDEIATFCQHINERRAYGEDDIHPSFLKYGGIELYKALQIVFTYSYQYSVIPRRWTKSIVVPLFKGGDTTAAESYRPISLTSCIMRTMERLIKKKLMTQLDGTLHQHQYGFRPQHSTHDAIYHLVGDLRTAVRGSSTKKRLTEVPVAFLDLKKAFDRVWHDGLLYQLYEHGICNRMWLWLKAFLSNRFSCVVNGSITSTWHQQHYGVPQGAVLSPLLFSVFINAAARAINDTPQLAHPNTTLLLFADDIAYYANVSSPTWQQRFQRGLDLLHTWADKFCQEFNSSKSAVVWFTRRQHSIAVVERRPQFHLGRITLQQADVYKYLGLHLSSNFRWTIHHDYVLDRARHDAYHVRRIVDYTSKRPIHFTTIRTLYVSYLIPRLLYGVSFLTDIRTGKWLYRLQSQLCSTLRMILGLPHSSHTLSLLADTGLLPLNILQEYYILRTAHRLHQLPTDHAAYQLFQTQYAAAFAAQDQQPPRPTGDPSRIRSYTRILVQIERSWNCSHTESIQHLTKRASERALHQWKTSQQCDGLLMKSLKDEYTQTYSLYIDTASNARVRARFRHNRIGNNVSMFKMNHGANGTTPSPNCLSCPDEPETIHHMIMDCPLYVSPRQHLIDQLASQQTILTIKVVLGMTITANTLRSEQERAKAVIILRDTADFLRQIIHIRTLFCQQQQSQQQQQQQRLSAPSPSPS